MNRGIFAAIALLASCTDSLPQPPEPRIVTIEGLGGAPGFIGRGIAVSGSGFGLAPALALFGPNGAALQLQIVAHSDARISARILALPVPGIHTLFVSTAAGADSAQVALLQGDSGPTGVDGVPGPTGADGPPGPTGGSGAAGVAGPTGRAGSNGAAGAAGFTGPTGSASTNPADDVLLRQWPLTETFGTATTVTNSTSSGVWRSDTSQPVSWSGNGSVTLTAGQRIVTIASYGADLTAGVQFSFGTGGLLSVVLRYDPAAGTGYLFRFDSGAGSFDAILRSTDLGAGSLAPIGAHILDRFTFASVTHNVRAIARGSNLAAWTDGLPTATATDTTYASGSMALQCESGTCTIAYVQISTP